MHIYISAVIVVPGGIKFLHVFEDLGDAAAAKEASGDALDVDGAAYVQVVQAEAGDPVLVCDVWLDGWRA